MDSKDRLPAGGPNHLARRVSELHAQLRQANPITLASHTGADFLPAGSQQGTFYLPFWGQDISLTYPEFVGRDNRTGKMLGTMAQALLAYYFTISDGTDPTGQWISFSELPDGRFYTAAFQGYTGGELLKTFGNDDHSFARSAAQIGGWQPRLDETLGDKAFAFQVFPHVTLLVVCWLGDEDFPPSYRILFDAAISHHLSTDACAILGSTLTRRLIKAYEQLKGH
ncbi:MAG: DUF3786 domain-containing protein [Chloroflexota bacterium]|jgi:hypothetical protein